MCGSLSWFPKTYKKFNVILQSSKGIEITWYIIGAIFSKGGGFKKNIYKGGLPYRGVVYRRGIQTFCIV